MPRKKPLNPRPRGRPKKHLGETTRIEWRATYDDQERWQARAFDEGHVHLGAGEPGPVIARLLDAYCDNRLTVAPAPAKPNARRKEPEAVSLDWRYCVRTTSYNLERWRRRALDDGFTYAGHGHPGPIARRLMNAYCDGRVTIDGVKL